MGPKSLQGADHACNCVSSESLGYQTAIFLRAASCSNLHGVFFFFFQSAAFIFHFFAGPTRFGNERFGRWLPSDVEEHVRNPIISLGITYPKSTSKVDGKRRKISLARFCSQQSRSSHMTSLCLNVVHRKLRRKKSKPGLFIRKAKHWSWGKIFVIERKKGTVLFCLC